MAALQQRLGRVPPSVQTKIYTLFDQGLVSGAKVGRSGMVWAATVVGPGVGKVGRAAGVERQAALHSMSSWPWCRHSRYVGAHASSCHSAVLLCRLAAVLPLPPPLPLPQLLPFVGLPSAWQCMPSDFDDRVLSLLTSLPAHDAEESVSKLESALRIPGSVRNPSAYLAGVIKRLSGAGSGPPGGPGGRAGGLAPPAASAQLAPAAGSVLEQLIAEGRMRPGDLEGRNLANVAALPPEMQLFIMRTFADRNLHGIRNMAGQRVGWGGTGSLHALCG